MPAMSKSKEVLFCVLLTSEIILKYGEGESSHEV